MFPFPAAPRWSRLCATFSFLAGLFCSVAAASEASATFKRGVSIGNWMAKMRRDQPFGGSSFTRDDVAWLAQHGFDHLRIPVDTRLLLLADGTLDEPKIARFLQAVGWARDNKLGVVLDAHFLPGGTAPYDAGTQDTAIFSDEKARAEAAALWGKLARRFIDVGAELRFELINEPFAPRNDQLNQLNRAAIAAIRAHDPKRVVYVTSNLSSSFATLADVVVPAEPNVAMLLHYDLPIFTHQRASWKQLPATMPLVSFPGTVPDLAGIVPPDHWAAKTSGTELKIGDVEAAFATVTAWLAKNAPGREVYIGNFGAYDAAPAESRRTYLATVRAAVERRGWGWAVWEYRGSFGVRRPDGTATVVLEALLAR